MEGLTLQAAGPPIDRREVEERTLGLGIEPPADYFDLMVEHDGFSGLYGGAFLQVYSLADLSQINSRAWVDAAWLVHFGSDGSNTSYAFDRRHSPNTIVAVDMIDRGDSREVGSSLGDLMAHIAAERASSLPLEILQRLKELPSSGAVAVGDLERLQRDLDLDALPPDYLQLVLLADGVEGFIASRYVALWRVREIAGLNGIAHTADSAPRLVLIGTDGAMMGFGLDTRSERPTYVSVPLVGLSWKRVVARSPSFSGLLEDLGSSDTAANPPAEPRKLGLNVYEITPVLLGGDAGDPANRTVLPLRKCLEASAFWNRQIAQVEDQSQPPR